MVEKETIACIRTDKLLEEAGWRMFDCEAGKAYVLLESNTKATRHYLDNLGVGYIYNRNIQMLS